MAQAVCSACGRVLALDGERLPEHKYMARRACPRSGLIAFADEMMRPDSPAPVILTLSLEEWESLQSAVMDYAAEALTGDPEDSPSLKLALEVIEREGARIAMEAV